MLFPLTPDIKAGIVLMGVAPLAPLAPGKMLKAGAPPSFTVGMYVALMLLAVVVVPATLALLSALFPVDVSIAPMKIARLVIISVLAPLVVGAVISAVAPAFAQRAAPVVLLLGNIGLVIFLLPALAVLARPMLALIGNGTIVVIMITVAAGLAAGHLLGGPEPADREALAFAAATRHPGIAAMIARENFQDHKLVPVLILFLLTGVVVSAVYRAWASRRAKGATSRA
jgi:BASS family bile acid:Na+ symporter